MNTPLQLNTPSRFTSFVLAALLTVAMLGGIDSLASLDDSAAQIAQTPATATATAKS